MKEVERIGNFVIKCFDKLPNYPWYYYLIGITLFIILTCIFYNYQNKKFIEKNGYPIINWLEIGLICGHGAFLYAGITWREYAIENAKKVLYANILIGYSWFAIIFLLLSLIKMYYKTKRKLGWLNIILAMFLTYILYAFTGIILGIIVYTIILSAVGNINWRFPKNKSYYGGQEEAFKQMGIAKNTPEPNIKNENHY